MNEDFFPRYIPTFAALAPWREILRESVAAAPRSDLGGQYRMVRSSLKIDFLIER